MSAMMIANAPCSWGSLEFEGLEGKAIGFAQMLDELAETGYQGTELGDWGYMPTDASVLHAELSTRRLELLGAFVPVGLKDKAHHASGVKTAVKIARLLAEVARFGEQDQQPLIVLADDNGTDPARTQNAGRVQSDLELSDSQWDCFAEGANHVARAVRSETGLRTMFHHHCAGYVETPSEIERLLRLTDPNALGLVFDTGHFVYGAGTDDPRLMIDFMNRHADRIGYIHFKDCDVNLAATARSEGWDYFEAVRRGIFCELGQGCVPFPEVLAWLRTHAYNGAIVVEQDVLPGMGEPKESARRNREYLKSIGV